MTTSPERFAPLTEVRLAQQGAALELVSPVPGKRLRLTPEALIAYLDDRADAGPGAKVEAGLRDVGVLGATPGDAGLAGVRHWSERGWYPSCGYYLWSRQVRYADLDDDDGEARRTALTAYRAEGDLPTRARPEGPALPLPPPRPGVRSLGEILLARRTHRSFPGRPTTTHDLGDVLGLGFASVARARARDRGDPVEHLNASGGVALDPYVLVYAVDGVSPGAYYYDLARHALVLVRSGDLREWCCDVLMGMAAPRSANFSVFLVADYLQYMWLYRNEYALRKLYMDVGFAGQELLLAAEERDIGTLVTPATKDGKVCELLGLDGVRFAPIYTLTMGAYGARRGDRGQAPG
jgi:SagB-type dehydrogenase family enzyme